LKNLKYSILKKTLRKGNILFGRENLLFGRENLLFGRENYFFKKPIFTLLDEY